MIKVGIIGEVKDKVSENNIAKALNKLKININMSGLEAIPEMIKRLRQIDKLQLDEQKFLKKMETIKKGFEPGESIVDFSQLEETTDKYDHILYRYNDGKFERVYKKGTEPEKIDSSEAGKQSQDDSPVGFEELLKLIDFEQVDRLNQIDELIKRVYPDGYPSIKYPDPRPTNPCANCSEWQRAQRTGEMLICNCTIPYMNQPYYGTWTFNIDRSGNTAQ